MSLPIPFKNAITRKFKMTYVPHIIFVWDSSALDSLSYIYKFHKFDFLINASHTSKKQNLLKDFKDCFRSKKLNKVNVILSYIF